MKGVKVLCELLLTLVSWMPLASAQLSPIISPPLDYTVGPDMKVTLSNPGPRTVVAYVVKVVGKRQEMRAEHDFFFEPHEFHPGDQWDVDVDRSQDDPNLTSYKITVVWCQFLDGTQWGDRTVGARMLAQRSEEEALLKSLSTANDATFTAMVNQNLTGRHDRSAAVLAFGLNRAIQNGDMVSARTKVANYLHAAAARHATGNF